MITIQDIIDETLTWVDTPYHHKAIVKGHGVDCAMLIAGVGIELGMIDKSAIDTNYSIQWHLHHNEEVLIESLEKYGCTKSDKPMEVGDILVFKYGRVSSHLGILINKTQIVHAAQDADKVVINDLNEEFERRLTYIYKFPGIK